jgi:hypothetical protein
MRLKLSFTPYVKMASGWIRIKIVIIVIHRFQTESLVRKRELAGSP